MMMPARGRIGLGQDNPIAAHLIDGAEVGAIRSNHLHMLIDPAQRLALIAALCAPAAEFLFKRRLMLATVFVIIAVERVDLAAAPLMIIGVGTAAHAAARFIGGIVARVAPIARI